MSDETLRSLDFLMWTFLCDWGSKCRKGEWEGNMGLSPEKQSWMRFMHFKNASLQIEYS